jgi:hypothetical protein
MSKQDNENIIIEATLFWPNLTKKNEMSGKYQVDLGQLGKDAVKGLQGLGLNVRSDSVDEDSDKPDRGEFLTAKSAYPFKVLFKQGVEVVDPKAIGNGTKARVKIGAYEWSFKGKKGVSASAKVIQVTELAKYEQDVDPDFADSVAAPVSDMDDDIDALFSDN